MKVKISAVLLVLLLAARISASGQTSGSCPVSITLVKLTEDRFTVKVSGQSGKSNPDKALLFLTLETVDDQNRKHWDSAHTIEIGTYTQTGPWNNANVRRGKLILRIDKFLPDRKERPVPLNGCRILERAFDFSTADATKPTGN